MRPYSKQWHVFKAVWFLLLLALLAGCQTTEPTPTQPPSSPTPVVLATSTPLPTATPLPSPTAAAISNAPTDTPSVTPTPRQQQVDTIVLPTATATPTPIPGIACATTANVNLREGPGTGQRIIEVLPGGTQLQAQQRLPDNSWLLVSTAGQTGGWLAEPLVQCATAISTLPLTRVAVVEDISVSSGLPAANDPAPTPTPEPTVPAGPTEVPVPQQSWRAEYYDNASLLGEPVLVRVEPNLDFQWFLGSPAPEIPSDNFSARWTGQVYFDDPGDYEFRANVDDGVRVYVDGRLVIDAWHTSVPIEHKGKVRDLQPGWHTVTVEYFESGGYARARVWADDGQFVDDEWFGEYYNNLDLQGTVQFTRNSDEIDFDWGHESPGPNVRRSDFSIRWTRTVALDFGDYRFFAEVEEDDWVRVTVDGWQIFEEYADDDDTITGFFANLGGDNHTFVVEFKDHGGKAKLDFWWERD